MRTRYTLYILVLFSSFLSCQKENDSAFALRMKDEFLKTDTSTFTLNFDEQLPANEKPVCLRFIINSKERFSNYLSLESHSEVDGENILISIDNIKDNGKCPTEHLSTYNPDYKCQAQGMLLLNDMKRGTYNIDIRLMRQSVANGKLILTDQVARIEIEAESKIDLKTNSIHIVPDSCIFGHFYQFEQTSTDLFKLFLDEMKSVNCREITLQPGKYREFDVNEKGGISFNSSQQLTIKPFILKTENNFGEIIVLLNNFLDKHPEAYGFIFEDSYGQYYNIKTGS